MSTSPDAKQAARLRVLIAYYELSDGEPLVFLEPAQIEKRTGLSAQEVDAARRHLIRSGLVEERAASGVASISHDGVLEVERIQAETRQSSRLTVLGAAYDLVRASVADVTDTIEIQQRTGLDEQTVCDAVFFLSQTGSVRVLGSNPGPVFALTAKGIREVEAARAPAPGPPTATPPVVMTFHAPVGTVQTGAASAANVTQNVGANLAEMLQVIAAIRSALPAERHHARETLEDIEVEVKTGTPRPSRIRAYVGELWRVAVDVSAIAPFVIQLAKMLGIDLPGRP